MDEYLLEIDLMNFLISVVDAQLLKAIMVKYLETIDIEQLNDLQFRRITLTLV